MKVSLHRYAKPRAFRTSQEFIDYAATQQAKFEGMASSHPSAYGQWGRTCSTHWARAQALAVQSGGNEIQISEGLRDNPCLDYESPLTDMLRRCTQEKRPQAIDGALRALKASYDNNHTGNLSMGAFNGAIEAIMAATITEYVSSKSSKKTLAAIVDDHEARLSNILENDQINLMKKREEFDGLSEDIETRSKQMETEISSWFQKSKSQWVEIYNNFIEQLKTETAVELWQNRSKDHRLRHDNLSKLIRYIGIFGLVFGVLWIFIGFTIARWMFPDDVTAQIATYSASSVILFTMFIWTLRVLVRSMMSESHLATDASGRAAMAHTYLALSKDDAASQEDRTIILAALFAPVSDGLVKDDGLPILSPAAIAASAITNPRSS
ncbi:hypothetical protein M2341_003171 [Sphingobium sp. B7D2B]|uniref:DUF6161 domain-containing protein n=1 Tax=Sphingobium sp. B7D2B TaxID=2940583 RepID=UPI0022254C19|nr:DUF6161 domain-containing protein [Sphingobium sp. B7D2B]MCW2367724.1 hypothetical protein [Sphingobium sp. B7D2B]